MKINRRLQEAVPSHHVNEIMIDESRIRARVDELVTEMVDDCRADDLVLVGILRGSFMFLADLVRALYLHGIHPRIDFMTLSSYGSGTESSGQVEVQKDLSVDVEGADVLVIDDILDTGRTLKFACDRLVANCPTSHGSLSTSRRQADANPVIPRGRSYPARCHRRPGRMRAPAAAVGAAWRIAGVVRLDSVWKKIRRRRRLLRPTPLRT